MAPLYLTGIFSASIEKDTGHTNPTNTPNILLFYFENIRIFIFFIALF